MLSGLFHKLIDSVERSGIILFFREVRHNPAAIGAVLPSSKALATEIAFQANQMPEGFIVELGAGTGSITDALLREGIAPERIIVIERAAKLAAHLQQRYPQLRIIHGDASHLSQLLGEDAPYVGAIVSSLPLLSLPARTVSAIRNQLKRVLKPHTLFIQFTYSFRRDNLSLGFRRLYSKRIWINIPRSE